MNPTSWYTRLARLWRLFCWLVRTAVRLHGLNNASVECCRQVLHDASAEGLKILNVHTTVCSRRSDDYSGSLLVVSNHISWLDILVISTLYPSSFIAMQEIRKWPVIGRMVSNAGTVYIDRSSRKNVDTINKAIAAKMAAGASVCFFPEAHTSLGNSILPMKAALFQSAVDTGNPVLPLALRYYDNGTRTEKVSFAGVNLLHSLWRILSLRRTDVKVEVGALLQVQTIADADRFVLKDSVETFIGEIVHSDSPNPERVMPENG